jgi:hypothetical protein
MAAPARSIVGPGVPGSLVGGSEPAMQLTSRLAHSAQTDRSAREFLGDDHPLVRVMERASVAVGQSVVVAVVLVGGGAGWVEGLHVASEVTVAAALVEAVLLLRLANLRWLVRERACDLIIQGRADLPLDPVRRQRRRLQDRGHCEDLADWLDRTWMLAERSLGSRYQPAPFGSSRVIVSVRSELAEISARLREDAPGVRGVALVERLLSEGGSALHGASPSALRQELRRIRFMLGA